VSFVVLMTDRHDIFFGFDSFPCAVPLPLPLRLGGIRMKRHEFASLRSRR
jgi:hypothetical protein